MEKILAVVIVVGVIVNFITMFGLFSGGGREKRDELSHDKGATNEFLSSKKSVKDKMIGYSLLMIVLLFFLFISFSSWFVVVKDLVNFL